MEDRILRIVLDILAWPLCPVDKQSLRKRRPRQCLPDAASRLRIARSLAAAAAIDIERPYSVEAKQAPSLSATAGVRAAHSEVR